MAFQPRASHEHAATTGVPIRSVRVQYGAEPHDQRTGRRDGGGRHSSDGARVRLPDSLWPAAATSCPTGQRLRTRDRAGRGDAPLPDDRFLDLPLGPLLPPDRGVAEPGHLASDERAADPAQPVLAVANDHHRQPDPAAHRLGTVYVRPVLQRLIAVRRGPQVTMSVEASTMTTHMKPPSCP